MFFKAKVFQQQICGKLWKKKKRKLLFNNNEVVDNFLCILLKENFEQTTGTNTLSLLFTSPHRVLFFLSSLRKPQNRCLLCRFEQQATLPDDNDLPWLEVGGPFFFVHNHYSFITWGGLVVQKGKNGTKYHDVIKNCSLTDTGTYQKKQFVQKRRKSRTTIFIFWS